MKDFVIATDSDTEIPLAFAEQYDIPVFLMPYTVDGEEKLYDLGKNTDFDEFYQKLADGSDAATSTRAPKDIEDFFRDIVKDGKDVLQLSFSSQLSAHYSYCEMAKKTVLEEYPDARIELIDTKRISMGAGVLVMQAQNMKEQGKSLDEIKTWVEDNLDRAQAWFSVDDLNYLKKGGRLSGTAAMIGTILSVKPILQINYEGKLVPVDKVKGTKNVLLHFVDTVKNNIEQPEEQTIYVMHAGDIKTAQKLESMLKEEVSCKDIVIQDIGPVIGCHTGPGAMAVVFMGKSITA